MSNGIIAYNFAGLDTLSGDLAVLGGGGIEQRLRRRPDPAERPRQRRRERGHHDAQRRSPRARQLRLTRHP